MEIKEIAVNISIQTSNERLTIIFYVFVVVVVFVFLVSW